MEEEISKGKIEDFTNNLKKLSYLHKTFDNLDIVLPKIKQQIENSYKLISDLDGNYSFVVFFFYCSFYEQVIKTLIEAKFLEIDLILKINSEIHFDSKFAFKRFFSTKSQGDLAENLKLFSQDKVFSDLNKKIKFINEQRNKVSHHLLSEKDFQNLEVEIIQIMTDLKLRDEISNTISKTQDIIENILKIIKREQYANIN